MNGVPTIPTAAALLEILESSGLDETAIFKVALPVPAAFVAVSGMAKFPVAVGRPEIAPVAGLSASPAGKFAAANVVGAFVPETEYAKSVATYAMAAAGDEMTGADCGPEKIVTEITPASQFYPGEDYHQKYLVKNPGGYNCHYLQPE